MISDMYRKVLFSIHVIGKLHKKRIFLYISVLNIASIKFEHLMYGGLPSELWRFGG